MHFSTCVFICLFLASPTLSLLFVTYLWQVAKGNISYMTCHRNSIHAEIMAHLLFTGTLPLPLSLPLPLPLHLPPSRSTGAWRTYTPVRNSVYGESSASTQGQGQGQGQGQVQVQKDVWGRSEGSKADIHTSHPGGFRQGESVCDDAAAALENAIVHVMLSGPASASSRGQTQRPGKGSNSGALPTIWTRVCHLHEKQGENADGQSLPADSLGILRSISSITIDQSPLHAGEGPHNQANAVSNTTERKAITLSPRYKRSRDSEEKDKNTVRQDLPVSLADTWRAAGFHYGAESKNILQAQIHFPGNPGLLSVPCDKVILLLVQFTVAP
jgi:hypothetical protein